jgi:hypothetical protein
VLINLNFETDRLIIASGTSPSVCANCLHLSSSLMDHSMASVQSLACQISTLDVKDPSHLLRPSPSVPPKRAPGTATSDTVATNHLAVLKTSALQQGTDIGQYDGGLEMENLIRGEQVQGSAAKDLALDSSVSYKFASWCLSVGLMLFLVPITQRGSGRFIRLISVRA